MKVNVKTHDAIAMLLYLAKKKTPVTSKELGNACGTSPEFAQNIMQKLKNNSDIVRVIMGARGGYVLNKALEDIRIGDVFAAEEETVNIYSSELSPQIVDLYKNTNTDSFFLEFERVLAQQLNTSLAALVA